MKQYRKNLNVLLSGDAHKLPQHQQTMTASVKRRVRLCVQIVRK